MGQLERDLPHTKVLESCWPQTLVQIEGPLGVIDLKYNNCGNPDPKKVYKKMHTQCSENKQTVSVKVSIYIISNGVCTCVPSLGLLAPAFQEKQAKTHKKAKMGYLDSIDLEHCMTVHTPMQL